MKFLWTTIHVKDMDESIAFYSNMLGLQLIKRFPAGPGMEIAFMGNNIDGETLIELINDSSVKEIDFGDMISVGFSVESVESMLEKIKSYNIPVHSGPMNTPTATFFIVKDPNGLSVQFFQQK